MSQKNALQAEFTTVMDSTELPLTNPSDCDEVLILKKKLAETEEKLVKFKKFVVNLRNERTQLQDKVSENDSEIEKLKAEVGKFQNKSYQQIFQNFQSLQAEYDKAQDELDFCKKGNKSLESDLLKCSQELSQFRETCTTQKDEICQLKNQLSSQQMCINGHINSNKELESKIIVLQTECKSERKKYNDFQIIENEKNSIHKELIQKNDEINELKESFENSLQKIALLENELCEKNSLLSRYEGSELEKQQLKTDNQRHFEKVESQKEHIELSTKIIEELQCKNESFEKKIADLQLNNSQKVSSLELIISDLENKLTLNEQDLNLNSNKFEEYKQRVSSVLKENKLNNFEHSKIIEDLNFKIEGLTDENNALKNKHNDLLSKVEVMCEENKIIKQDLLSRQTQQSDCDELKTKLNSLSKENFKLINTIEQMKESFTKEKQTLLNENLFNIENTTLKYENKIKELEDEIINVRNASDDSNSIVNSNASFEEIKDENISFPSSNNSNSEKNFLEEILNIDSSSRSSDALHSSNIDNLTQLLSESENSITLLSEQNRLLKEEIRRLQRSIERMDIANNLEYLKNVLMKFLTIKGADERERLTTVLTTILKLTPEERDVFHQYIQDSSSQPNSKWGLWQWA